MLGRLAPRTQYIYKNSGNRNRDLTLGGRTHGPLYNNIIIIIITVITVIVIIIIIIISSSSSSSAVLYHVRY